MNATTLVDRILAQLPPYNRHADALRYVVNLHSPVETRTALTSAGDGPWEERSMDTPAGPVYLDDGELMCFADPTPQRWPCPTILAVANGLGVEP